MWINRNRYDSLIRAEAAGDYLRVRVNELNMELATLRAEITGKPQRVATIERANQPRTPSQIGAAPFVRPDSVSDRNDPGLSVADFDDLGDEKARVEGVEVDDQGRVTL